MEYEFKQHGFIYIAILIFYFIWETDFSVKLSGKNIHLKVRM